MRFPSRTSILYIPNEIFGLGYAFPKIWDDKDLNLIRKWEYAKECCDFLKISRGNVSVCATYNSNKKSDFMIRYGFIFSFIPLFTI